MINLLNKLEIEEKTFPKITNGQAEFINALLRDQWEADLLTRQAYPSGAPTWKELWGQYNGKVDFHNVIRGLVEQDYPVSGEF